MKWLAGARLAGQAINWVITLVVIRLLAPSDYGLMALASILIGFANLFRELGLYSAMVQNPKLTQRQIEQTFGLLIICNTAIFSLLLIIAPAVASFFGDPRLTDIVRVLSIQFPVAAVGLIQDAMLSRRMAFKHSSIVNFVTMLSNAFVTLVFALSGAGVWALVWGSLAGACVRSIGMVLAARHWCIPRFVFDGDIKGMMRFGGFTTATRILWYSYQQADKVILGKWLGQGVLGQYSVAATLASMPLTKFSGLMNQVGLAAYSKVQSDPATVRFYFCKTIRMVACFAFPVFWGISSVSPELVNVVLGNTWQPAIFPLSVLSLIMPFRMIETSVITAYDAVGKPEITTGNQLITFLIMPPAFLVGVQWGLTGICLAWLFVFPLVALIRLWRSLPVINLNLGHYFSSIAGPAIGGLLMFAVVSSLRIVLVEPYFAPVSGLIFLMAVGAIVYVGYMWLFRRDDCLEVIELVQKRQADA